MTIRGPLVWIFAAVLLVSLAANVLIAGVVLGHLNGPPPPGDDFDHLVGMIVRPYPPDIQTAIREGARADRGELQQRLDAMCEARRRAFDALRADPFDRAVLLSAYADIRAAADGMQQVVQRIEADAMAKTPAALRQKIRPPRGPFP